MTRPAEGVTATDAHDAPRRMVRRVPGVPGARAILGGLLVALAGVGTFVSWQQTTGNPDQAYAVATRTLRPGDAITDDVVRFESIDLPVGVAGAAFTTPAELEGRVLVAPVGEGELLQLGAVSDQGAATPAAEVSITLARDLAVDGRLELGDSVDVYATHDDTWLVAEGLQVIGVSEGAGAFGDGSELTVTLALTGGTDSSSLIHAAREGQVTLVRTTHASRGSGVTSSGADESDSEHAGRGLAVDGD